LDRHAHNAHQLAVPSNYRPDDESRNHDIALIKLDTPFNYTDECGPALLADEETPQLTSDHFCTVAGWGETETSV